MLKSVLAAAAAAAFLSTAPSAQDKPKIGLIQIDLSNPSISARSKAPRKPRGAPDFDLVVTSGEGDVTKQIQAMENLINEGVDAISINFIDAAAFGPTMAKAAGGQHPGDLPAFQDRRLRGDARLRRALHRQDRRRICRRAAQGALQRRGEGRGRQPSGPARPGPQHRPFRRLHRRHGAVSRRQGGGAGADQLGSDQGGVDHRELDDRLSEPRPDLRQQRQPDRPAGRRRRPRRQAGPGADRLGRRHRARPRSGQERRDGEHRAARAAIFGLLEGLFPLPRRHQGRRPEGGADPGRAGDQGQCRRGAEARQRPGRQHRRTSRSRSRWSTSSRATDQYGIDRSRSCGAVRAARSTSMPWPNRPPRRRLARTPTRARGRAG